VSDPIEDIQTITVPPGGAVMMDFEFEEPGNFTLVDHALVAGGEGSGRARGGDGEPLDPGTFDPGGEEVGEGAEGNYGGH
jgi:nitrite reductase (NO-forming)